MEDIHERVAALEANESNIFHQLTEIKDEVRDIRRLTTAVEKIAVQTKNTADKVDDLCAWKDRATAEPADDARYYRRTVVGCVLTTVIGAVMGAVLALVLK